MSSEIINITPYVSSAYRSLDGVRPKEPVTNSPDAPSRDIVEFSDFARSLAREIPPSSFRLARVEAIRLQIAEGTFETPERIRGTVDRLLDVVG